MFQNDEIHKGEDMARTVRESLEIRDELYERVRYHFEDLDEAGVNVYYSEDSPEGVPAPSTDWALMLNVQPDRLSIFPFKRDYGGYVPKYEGLEVISVTRRRHGDYPKPDSKSDVEEILGHLPAGLERSSIDGLGFSKDDRFIPQTLAGVAKSIHVLIHGGDTPPTFDHGILIISELYLKRLVKGMRSIVSRYQRQARTDRQLFAYNELLSAIDSDRFPMKQKRVDAQAMFELVKVGRISAGIPKAAQKNVVDLVSDNAQAIAKNDPETLYKLAAKIESATLQEMITKYEGMLSKDLNETRWQKFFEANTFILSMAFAVPTIFVQETPYVNGKRINGRGGKFSDFLMRGQGTGNVALIEIKAPGTALLTPYRDDQPGPSKDLAGSVTQVLGQRRKLTTGWHSLKGEDDGTLRDSELYSPQAVVLIGTLPTTKLDREAFEAFRNVLKDVAVITFDELLLRLKFLHEALATEPTPEHSPTIQTKLSFTGGEHWDDDDVPF